MDRIPTIEASSDDSAPIGGIYRGVKTRRNNTNKDKNNTKKEQSIDNIKQGEMDKSENQHSNTYDRLHWQYELLLSKRTPFSTQVAHIPMVEQQTPTTQLYTQKHTHERHERTKTHTNTNGGRHVFPVLRCRNSEGKRSTKLRPNPPAGHRVMSKKLLGEEN